GPPGTVSERARTSERPALTRLREVRRVSATSPATASDPGAPRTPGDKTARRLTGLRRSSVAISVIPLCQYGLGMAINLYIHCQRPDFHQQRPGQFLYGHGYPDRRRLALLPDQRLLSRRPGTHTTAALPQPSCGTHPAEVTLRRHPLASITGRSVCHDPRDAITTRRARLGDRRWVCVGRALPPVTPCDREPGPPGQGRSAST